MNLNEPSNEKQLKALSESRGCRHCGGAGLLPVYNRDYEGQTIIEWFRPDELVGMKAGIVAAHCICEYGKWLRGNCPVTLRDRIPDFREAMNDRGEWRVDNPTTGEIPDEYFELKPVDVLRKLLAKELRIEA